MLVFEIFATSVLLLKGTAKGEMDLVQDSTGTDLCSQLFLTERKCILKNEELIIQCRSLVDRQTGSLSTKKNNKKTYLKHYEKVPGKRKISGFRSHVTRKHPRRRGTSSEKLVAGRYDSTECIYFYMTTTHLYRFDATSRTLKGLATVSRPDLVELGYAERPLFWTEYHAPYTIMKFISNEDSLTHVFYKTPGFIYGFGLSGSYVYICGNHTVRYNLHTRKMRSLPSRYRRCHDIGFDGKGFYVLYKNVSNTEWKLTRVPETWDVSCENTWKCGNENWLRIYEHSLSEE